MCSYSSKLQIHQTKYPTLNNIKPKNKSGHSTEITKRKKKAPSLQGLTLETAYILLTCT